MVVAGRWRGRLGRCRLGCGCLKCWYCGWFGWLNVEIVVVVMLVVGEEVVVVGVVIEYKVCGDGNESDIVQIADAWLVGPTWAVAVGFLAAVARQSGDPVGVRML